MSKGISEPVYTPVIDSSIFLRSVFPVLGNEAKHTRLPIMSTFESKNFKSPETNYSYSDIRLKSVLSNILLRLSKLIVCAFSFGVNLN